MSDAGDWNAKIIEEFRANHGQVGGQFEGAPVLILHTTGARSSQERVNPLMYLDLEDQRYVFASKAGADRHPDWYHNLLAHPNVTLEVGAETYGAIAHSVPEPDRTRVFEEQARRFPGFNEYQKNTSRLIPVVELVRIA